MSDLRPEDFNKEMDEEMTVTIETDDGDYVCSIITILTVDDKDYIALSPQDEDGNPLEEVWFYGYKETPGEEPELIYIEDDEELEAVMDKYDEFLDDQDFENM